jgi:hypothetical protein
MEYQYKLYQLQLLKVVESWIGPVDVVPPAWPMPETWGPDLEVNGDRVFMRQFDREESVNEEGQEEEEEDDDDQEEREDTELIEAVEELWLQDEYYLEASVNY